MIFVLTLTEMWGFFVFLKNYKVVIPHRIMTGLIGPVFIFWIRVEFSLLKKNKIVFGGMKFSYYIYLNKTQTLWMIE